MKQIQSFSPQLPQKECNPTEKNQAVESEIEEYQLDIEEGIKFE